ncbi:MAG: hypothetical protein MUC42_07560 [Bryobacter sp.]|jgi:hypothetical protein|nr:hypothetical protein [Bryobacter sp.]
MRLLALDTEDPRLALGLASVPRIYLLHCWRCRLAAHGFAYRITPGRIEVLRAKPDVWWRKFRPAQPHPPLAFSGAYVDLVNAPAPALPAHRISAPGGGTPPCPVCGAATRHLASLCDSAAGPDLYAADPEFRFTCQDSMRLDFHFCPQCAVVRADEAAPTGSIGS